MVIEILVKNPQVYTENMQIYWKFLQMDGETSFCLLQKLFDENDILIFFLVIAIYGKLHNLEMHFSMSESMKVVSEFKVQWHSGYSTYLWQLVMENLKEAQQVKLFDTKIWPPVFHHQI